MICPTCNQPTQPFGRFVDGAVVRLCGNDKCHARLPDEAEPSRSAPPVAGASSAEDAPPPIVPRMPKARPAAAPVDAMAGDYVAAMEAELATINEQLATFDALTKRREKLRRMIAAAKE